MTARNLMGKMSILLKMSLVSNISYLSSFLSFLGQGATDSTQPEKTVCPGSAEQSKKGKQYIRVGQK